MRSFILGALPAILALAPGAHAQKAAERDTAGHFYCNSGNGVDLRETGDGGYKVDLAFEHKGDAAAAVYPTGSARLFAPGAELGPFVSINYEFHLGGDGTPLDRPRPVRVSVSTGRFAGQRLEPLESLVLQLRAGTVTTPPITLNEAYYNIALVGGEIGPAGSENPYDFELSPKALGELVLAFESGERWIMLAQNGAEVARIPVPRRDIASERNRGIAWVRAALPLMREGKCPA